MNAEQLRELSLEARNQKINFSMQRLYDKLRKRADSGFFDIKLSKAEFDTVVTGSWADIKTDVVDKLKVDGFNVVSSKNEIFISWESNETSDPPIDNSDNDGLELLQE